MQLVVPLCANACELDTGEKMYNWIKILIKTVIERIYS